MSKETILLIEQCKKGNQKAQLQIYNLYCEAMFFIACRYLKNEEEAKDAMQEGFLKAFLKIDTTAKETHFGAWLKRIIINQCIDILKKKKLETTPLDDLSVELIDENDWDFDADITREEVIAAIEQLPIRYGLVLNLYLMEGYNHSEISEIMQIPIKTSRTHLRRGKLQLQELLKEKRHEARY
ncbi:RNA polymerase sigma factor [Flavobacteriaceae bacterium S356]|uniref:RNA polymerase sigma factor n=1 Tax=Asprobacillus argus TaxID=3076534 RepID=A0ABU3LC95_9FLAO|nr:RNA polymerase sigma factor [Flavobacteriaceae bacterium S356]